MPTPPNRPRPRPLQLGPYRIVTRIATGGMGAVYRAFDTGRELGVALKVLAPDLAEKPVMLRRFELEAQHGRRLAPHENIVTLYDAGMVRGFHYLALELIEGVDLKEAVASRGTLSVEESLPLIAQAARAVGHLHRAGITHRDIKPSNFLLTAGRGRPVVKLIDLGLAHHPDDAADEQPRPPGNTLGTIDYLAPEQARNCAAADVRSDIYSLGCTWFHLLAGTPPFPGGTPTERVRRHAEVPPPDVREWNADVPGRIAGVLARMLAKAPAERYLTPADLLRDLEAGDFSDLTLDSSLPAATVPG